MRIAPFTLERYFARYEFASDYLLSSSDCETIALGELLALVPGSEADFMALGLGYNPSLGMPSLRDAIAEMYRHCEVGDIVTHTGAGEAIFTAMNALLAPGDHVIVQYPAYQSLHEVPRSIGCDVTLWQTAPETGWALDVDFLAEAIRPETKMIVINSPHNPTGYLADRATIDAIVGLADRHGLYVFSDEVYHYGEYNPADRIPPMADLSPRGISVGVLSKSFGLPGLRLGWVASPVKAVTEAVAAYKDYTTICNTAPSEFLAEIAIRHREALFSRNMDIIQANLPHLRAFMTRHAGVLDWVEPRAGCIGFPWSRDGSPAQTLADRLIAASVMLLPGDVYGPGFASHFRIGYGRRNFPEALARFEDVLERLPERRLAAK